MLGARYMGTGDIVILVSLAVIAVLCLFFLTRK